MENFKMSDITPEKNKKGEEISRRSFLGKAAKIGAAFLGAGAIGACDRIIGGPSDEELERMEKEKIKKSKRNAEEFERNRQYFKEHEKIKNYKE